jgi:hypothetical protein
MLVPNSSRPEITKEVVIKHTGRSVVSHRWS